MTLQATVSGQREQKGAGVLVTCAFLHVESTTNYTLRFMFPVGMDVQNACEQMLAEVEAHLIREEADAFYDRVRANRTNRAGIDANVKIGSPDQVHKHILGRMLTLEGSEAYRFDFYLQEFTDNELFRAGLVANDAEGAQWKSNSADNKANVLLVNGYDPLAP